MRALPARRMESAKRERVKVDSGSLIHVERNAYSVNSRLIGERVEARMYVDHVEVWYGQKKVEDLPRLRGRGKHRVDYRHIIDWLVRKPGAFENYRYREDLFPTSRFRMAYDALQESDAEAGGKGILEDSEAGGRARARSRWTRHCANCWRSRRRRRSRWRRSASCWRELDSITPVTMVEVAAVDLTSFDQLCPAMEVRQ